MLLTSMACSEWKRVVMYEVSRMTAVQKLYIFITAIKIVCRKRVNLITVLIDMKSLNSLEFPQTLVSSPIPI